MQIDNFRTFFKIHKKEHQPCFYHSYTCSEQAHITGLWINSGLRQWRGHGVATSTLFGVPSDILIWPHFHSQATVPFVLVGVCQSVDNSGETALIGGSSWGMKFSGGV